MFSAKKPQAGKQKEHYGKLFFLSRSQPSKGAPMNPSCYFGSVQCSEVLRQAQLVGFDAVMLPFVSPWVKKRYKLFQTPPKVVLEGISV